MIGAQPVAEANARWKSKEGVRIVHLPVEEKTMRSRAKDQHRVNRYNYATQFGSELPSLTSDIQRMLIGGQYILTKELSEFELAFGTYLDVSHVRGVNSGTDAIIIALLALGVRPGDEVITQANTFNATVAAICLVGATPVLVDVNAETFLIDERCLEEAITSRTRVLMPVHLFGKPTPMEKILALAEKHGVAVVEDAAQAHGARIDGKRVGSIGTIGCFSFHPSKNLAAAGDGGAVVTNDTGLDEEIRRRRELGQCGQNHHVVVGLNSKLDAIQARILSYKLQYLDEWNEKRRRVAKWYRERLIDVPLYFQALSVNEEHVFHLFQVGTDQRDELQNYLQRAGVDVVVRYPTPIHLQPAFAAIGWRKGQFPIAERLASELLCLPIRPDMGVDAVDYVTESIRTFFQRKMR
jgi:dTDP-4-amino-4,6-dideoxygalactose transaminase